MATFWPIKKIVIVHNIGFKVNYFEVPCKISCPTGGYSVFKLFLIH